MNFFRSLLGLDEEKNREIENHILEVNVRLEIEKEAEFKFNEVWNKLTEKQKHKVDDIFKRAYKNWIFPTRGSWLDARRYIAAEELKKLKEKK